VNIWVFSVSGCVTCWQDVVNVLVRNCSSKFVSIPLPGSTMLMLDMIHAATVVLSLPHDYLDCNRHTVIISLIIIVVNAAQLVGVLL